MKFIGYSFVLMVLMGVATAFWLNSVPVVRVLEVVKVDAAKPFEVDPKANMSRFFVPQAAVVDGKIRLVRAGHVVELSLIPDLDTPAPEGKMAVIAPLQDRELAIIPPYGDIPIGAQVRGERLGSGY